MGPFLLFILSIFVFSGHHGAEYMVQNNGGRFEADLIHIALQERHLNLKRQHVRTRNLLRPFRQKARLLSLSKHDQFMAGRRARAHVISTTCI
jgi:hypothetical protein